MARAAPIWMNGRESTQPPRPVSAPNEQLKEAEENLDQYFEHGLRMYERIKGDPEAYAEFKALTALLQKAYDTEQKVDCSSINPF